MLQYLIIYLRLTLVTLFISCAKTDSSITFSKLKLSENVLNYTGSPVSSKDRSVYAFSDLGAWFGYGMPSKEKPIIGFTGPFLMTQENGIWSSNSLSHLNIHGLSDSLKIISQKSYLSHLEQELSIGKLKIYQTLVFVSSSTAILETTIKNTSQETVVFETEWYGRSWSRTLHFSSFENGLEIISDKSLSKGLIIFDKSNRIFLTDSTYRTEAIKQKIEAGKEVRMTLSQSFIFPEYAKQDGKEGIKNAHKRFAEIYKTRRIEKEKILSTLLAKMPISEQNDNTINLLIKTILTMQNNWRVAAGELKHSGLFPSYNYVWFHGFWAWDSWKHAVALAKFDPVLAKEQIYAMFDFQNQNGFIADCVYRDTSIEAHNYRNTKPPLSAWAIWHVYQASKDDSFIKDIYPKLKKYHKWWYKERDADKDGICEYGSTDGTLIAAKWESGMDNAVRFDNSKIIKTSETAWSLDQESVDLNAYLYREKLYMSKLANILHMKEESKELRVEAEALAEKIRLQFWDNETGWFYDTDINGDNFIKIKGPEGWIPLWAKVATVDQASLVKNVMMDTTEFNTKMPLQTLTARHPKFKPNRGYWRGPVWLDQAYFGFKALENYGFNDEASKVKTKLIYNGEGVTKKGIPLRENYHPLTGKGLESKHFSWTAAHYLLMIID